jgi:hypothetical protein
MKFAHLSHTMIIDYYLHTLINNYLDYRRPGPGFH